ncbi:MAG: hypothetical protein ACYS7M_07345, partial [Planctomycetota bacterium]
DTGNTCTFVNSYGEGCPIPDTFSQDVVYLYTPLANECIDIVLCNTISGVDFKLYVYAGDAGGCPTPPAGETALDIACDDNACPPYPRIAGLSLNAGVDYWIVVDGSTAVRACGDYRIDIAPCGTLCQTPADCEDNNPCTVDDCDTNGLCQNTPVPTGTPCGDPGDTDCDHPDSCDGGICQPNLEPNGTPCNDGLFCNEGEACTGGVCGGGAARDCDDQEPCTDDTCDESGDTCTNTPIPGCCVSDRECDDGVYCNGTEFCEGPPVMQCQSGAPPDCNDSDPCTTDVCDDEQEACVNTLIPDCCLTDNDCDDDNACTDDVCNANVCENLPSPSGTPCGDAGATDCSEPDTCDGNGSCDPNDINEGGPCDDGDNCTDNDGCVTGRCVGTLNLLCETCSQGGDPGDPANQVSFQAFLTDASGDPVEGPVDLSFQFYDLGGTPVGNPIDVMSVPVDSGIVSTAIPLTETIFDGTTGLELGVSVNGTAELTPRIAVTPVPQAHRVSCATGDDLSDHLFLGGSDTAGELRLFTGGTGGRNGRAPGGTEFGSLSGPACGGEFTLQTIPAGLTTVELKACSGPGGHMLLSSSDGVETVKLRGGSQFDGAQLELRNDSGDNTIILDGDQGNGGWIYMSDGSSPTVSLDAEDGTGGGAVLFLAASTGTATIEIDGDESNDGVIRLFDAGENTSIRLHSDRTNSAGEISMFNDNGKETVELIAAEDVSNNGGQLRLRKANGTTTVTLDAELNSGGAGLFLENSSGTTTIEADADESNDGVMRVFDAGGNTAIRLHSDRTNSAGEISMFNDNGKETVELIAAEGASNNGGQIRLRKANGTTTITLDAEFGNGGDGRISTQELAITGGSDLSEQFDIEGPNGTVKPGMLVSIDPQRPGKLVISDRAYDRRVAGVISGAGGLKPGMLMGQSGSAADGQYPVALTGRVYCWADASDGPIQPGDLLTTSNVPGHAMKVTDHGQAQGAIIGKAMTGLEASRGLVLVLVSLQ